MNGNTQLDSIVIGTATLGELPFLLELLSLPLVGLSKVKTRYPLSTPTITTLLLLMVITRTNLPNPNEAIFLLFSSCCFILFFWVTMHHNFNLQNSFYKPKPYYLQNHVISNQDRPIMEIKRENTDKMFKVNGKRLKLLHESSVVENATIEELTLEKPTYTEV
ncbi:uncharacterized protein [Cicer arietinum]|uniref:uncharacterized protein isoform X2 n=1 Tax=Cicer arietinum TaxID=3827 RepID=UPI003CC646F7